MPDEKRHGTDAAYTRGCRCGPCRAAHARVQRETRARAQARAAKNPGLIPHGRISGYQYWGCRCPECTAVNTEVARRQNLQKSWRRAQG